MTREELVNIMDTSGEFEFDSEIAADRILLALAREREGEVVLGEGMWEDVVFKLYNGNPRKEPNGKRGQLIFRPAKGDR